MALERQSIEKKDFPIGRRGYDPEAVDAHLQVLADEIEELKRSSRRRSETLASAASEQVRSIVEAAETSAAEIQRQAEDEAREIRTEATTEARTTREQAVTQAREYVGKVSESTAVMLQRLDGMESELGALLESLRTGANRLNADLQLLEGNLSEVGETASLRPRFEPEPAPAPAPPPPRRAEPTEEFDLEPLASRAASPAAGTATPASTASRATAPARTAPVAPAVPEVDEAPGFEPEEEELALTDPAANGPAAEPAAVSQGDDDSEGARLIALNMALNGSSREETDRYLAENFQLSDRGGLLDEVYASVEG